MSDLRDTLTPAGHLGRQLGKFRLEKRLGSGAMGDVFLGVHVSLGNFVAVKLLNAAATRAPGGIQRFANEARAVAAIGHENIAGVIDQDQLPDGTPYIVMEFVEGTTLRELLVENGALPLKQSAQIALDALSAVGAAHHKGIVHRDLKPENVRVMPSGRSKVLDFGVAKLLDSPNPALSTDGAIIGTPHYMAPEQVKAEPIDGRADLYAIGVMLFECVTGQRPFDAPNMIALLDRQVNAAPPWPSKLRGDVPPALEQVILKALEKHPGRRFSSAEEMAAALRALLPALDGLGTLPTVTPAAAVYTPTRKEQAPPVQTPAPVESATPQPLRRPRSVLPFVFVVVLAAVSAVVTVAVMRWQPEQPAQPPTMVEAPKPQAEVAPPAPASVEALPPPPSPAPAAVVAVKPKPVRKPEVQPPPPEPKPEPKKSSVTFIETGGNGKKAPPDYDPKRFELIGYLPRAKALATAELSDAVLINMDAEGVGADGTADLTLSREFTANYWFRSPSRSKVDPRLPDRDQDIPCKVYVEVNAKGTETRVVTSSDGCKEKVLPPYRCSMAEVMKRGIAEGARRDKVGKVTYVFDGTWMVDQGDGEGETVYFSCP